ncbi:MAG: L-aspartate oxidase [Candidatus Margulisbacteria bacterium]|nr:L-aspartate oxidase [Candidatus Margulisiibacteriota bacterium]
MNQSPKITTCDFLIIGSGIAGLAAAIEAAKHGKTIILTKNILGETATRKAQGGIAAAIDKIRDSTQFHFEDTITAGAGLCDELAVRTLVTEGVERVKELIEMGAQFDRAETESGSGFSLALEGAHKRRRILHAGDATGEEIQRTLGSKILADRLVELYQHYITTDLILEDGQCIGAAALNLTYNTTEHFMAKSIIITTGGYGQLWLYTTNPEVATGDGAAMAYRAGAEVADMEFMQFHPTAMVQFEQLKDIIALPRFLISEAVRGEGGQLLNILGERFMQKYDVKGELAPRDIVARAIFQEMKDTNSSHVFLSLANIDAEVVRKRFPVIYATCLERGLDITKDNIPVAPAAHYAMGGIKTDINGQTNIPRLFAAGECASLGVHGANRLASNSLLDGLVFGHRAAACAAKITMFPSPSGRGVARSAGVRVCIPPTDLLRFKMVIKTTMWNNVGIIRTAESLKDALSKISAAENRLPAHPNTKEEIELKNMALVAKLIAQAALDRTESRGAHFRSDFPLNDDKHWKRHLVYRLGR